MGRTFQKETTKLLQAKRRRRRWKRAIVPFALTVVLATSSMLTYPAITLESSTICGMGDHTHTQECYQRQLICGRQECEAVAEKTETVLNCSLSVHEHTAECVDADGQNVCGQDAHTHGDGCYQTIYTPGVEGHKHTDACYQDVLICQKPQHTHSDACYPKQETSAAPEEPVNTETSVTPEKPASTGVLAESGEPANTEASTELGESANTEASAKSEESEKSDVPKDSETTETSEEEDSEIVWEAQTFTANGKDYTITVEAPASAKIPKGAVLTVKELQENTTPGEYQNYSQQAVAKVQQKLEKDVLYARYFKLAIEADGIEIQPAEKVTVKVTYRNSVENPSGAAVKAVFFGDTTEILDVKTNASGQNWNEAKVEVGKMTVLAIAGVGIEEAEVEAEETENVEAEAEAVEENKAEAEEEVEGIENLEQEVAVEDADPEKEAETEVDEETAEEADPEEEAEAVEVNEEDSEEAVEDEEEAETEETEPEVYILTATGEDYRIEASYTAEAELPEGTALVASEIEQGTEAYESYCQQALAAVQENERTILSFARFFDLTFFAETEEIEAKAPVTVKITYTGEEEVAFVQLENGMAVMVLQNEENEKESIIETESLGAYGIVAVEEIPEPILSFPTETKVFTTEVSGYSISVEVPENSFYETAYLKAEVRNWEELDTEVQNKLEAEGIDKNSSQSLDIRFENENGEEVEPVNKVSVTIKISDENVLRNATEEESKLDVYHVVESEDAETTVEQVASSTDGSVAVHSESSAVAAFDTDSFSIYTVTLTGKVITASGETYRIEVSYDENAGIPANAELAVSEIGTNSSEYQNYLNKAKQAIYESDAYELPYARFFDISILVNGEEIEPLTPVTVRIYFEDNVTSTANVTFETVHFTGNTVDTIETEVNTERQDNPIEFTAESFSVYGVAYQYTVDYYYGDMEYHMVGGSQMMLSELFTKLEIEEDTANIVGIEFTDESLVTFIQSDEDYQISSLEPFDTEEWLTITMEDGTVYEIQVLDGPGNGGNNNPKPTQTPTPTPTPTQTPTPTPTQTSTPYYHLDLQVNATEYVNLYTSTGEIIKIKIFNGKVYVYDETSNSYEVNTSATGSATVSSDAISAKIYNTSQSNSFGKGTNNYQEDGTENEIKYIDVAFQNNATTDSAGNYEFASTLGHNGNGGTNLYFHDGDTVVVSYTINYSYDITINGVNYKDSGSTSATSSIVVAYASNICGQKNATGDTHGFDFLVSSEAENVESASSTMKIQKLWDDDNADIRPDTIAITIIKKNTTGSETIATATLTLYKSVSGTSQQILTFTDNTTAKYTLGSNYTATVDGLVTVYWDNSGGSYVLKTYDYDVTESAAVSPKGDLTIIYGSLIYKETDSEDYDEYTITNTLIYQPLSITKTWVVEYSSTANSVTIDLHLNYVDSDNQTKDVIIDTFTLSKADGWTKTFDELQYYYKVNGTYYRVTDYYFVETSMTVGGTTYMRQDDGTYKDDNGNISPLTSDIIHASTATGSGQLFSVTLENKLRVTDVDFVIKKTDESGNLLSGATFKLMKGAEIATANSGINRDGTLVEDTNADGTGKGTYTIIGLSDGTYTLTEISAPAGYIILTTSLQFKVENGTVTEIVDTNNMMTIEKTSGISISVKNTAGEALPNTGGSGTLPYTLSGLLLMAIAMMYGFVLRRRKA